MESSVALRVLLVNITHAVIEKQRRQLYVVVKSSDKEWSHVEWVLLVQDSLVDSLNAFVEEMSFAFCVHFEVGAQLLDQHLNDFSAVIFNCPMQGCLLSWVSWLFKQANYVLRIEKDKLKDVKITRRARIVK